MLYFPLALAIALGAGLAGGAITNAHAPLAGALALSASWSAAALAYLWGRSREYLGAVLILLAAAGWLLGAHAIDAAMAPPLRQLLERHIGGFAIDAPDEISQPEPLQVEGRLEDDAARNASGVTLRVDVSTVWIGASPHRVTGGISVGVGGAAAAARLTDWTAGRVIRAPVLLRRPARYENEGLPDQERAMARRGIALVGAIKSAALVEVVSRGPWWQEAAARVRGRVRQAIGRSVGSRDQRAAAIATAILIGDRAGIDEDTERQLQAAGTYHVIAISGGNIAIFAGLILGSLAWLGIRGGIAAVATLCALALYALIAGGGASVARASLTAGVYLSVRLIDQRTAPANAIGITAAVLLLSSPLSIADVGFWLTFGATIGILVGLSRIRLSAAWPLAAAAGVLAASCSVELALAPISAMVFQRVTAAGLVLNFVALPAMTVVQIGAMALVACDLAGLDSAAGVLGRVVTVAADLLTRSATWLEYAPWLTWRVPSPSVVLVAGYYLSLAVAIWMQAGPEGRVAADPARDRERRRSLLTKAAIAAAAVQLVWIVSAPQTWLHALNRDTLSLTMFDVGQGDAMLVTFPNGRRLVVDTGGAAGAFDIGDRVLGPALRARTIRRLDYLAVTHGDPDHLGGAPSLIRDFLPREVWWGVPVPPHAPTANVRLEADRIRAAWRTLQRGDRVETGGVELRVHHPPPPDWERRRVRNDDSLVLELRYRNVSMLLTGDIGREVEQQLIPTLDLLPTVVLKVAHHGSATSSALSFIDRVHPAIALIGVGRGNLYGHPVRPVLERLQATGAAIFRTDLEGQIDVVTDGKTVTVSTFRGRRFKKGEATKTRIHDSLSGRTP